MLAHASRDHVNDTGPKGVTGHNGSDGSSVSKRIERYGVWQGTNGENISYGCKTGKEIVLQLIIDDGVPSRGHRRNIFNSDYYYIGSACGNHKVYEAMCVMDFAGGMVTKDQAKKQENNKQKIINHVKSLKPDVSKQPAGAQGY